MNYGLFLQSEIMETLMGNIESSPSILSTCFSNSAFTKTFQEMAKYYFDQGGKLFRPTICLLMARACNQFEPKSLVFLPFLNIPGINIFPDFFGLCF